MKTARIKYYFVCLAFLGTSCIQEPSPGLDYNISAMAAPRKERIRKAVPEQVKIVLLGNSLTEGGGNWNEKLNREDVYNCGQGGYTTGQFFWLLDSCVFPVNPGYCFIMGGINDLSLGVPVERIFKNYILLINQLREKDIHVIVQLSITQSEYENGNPEMLIEGHVANNKGMRILNTMLEEYCREKNIPVLKPGTELCGERGLYWEYSTDGTHLNPEGYDIWSSVIKQFLESQNI